MNDTPQHIKQLQFKAWLSKTHPERLLQFVIDNDAFFKMIEQIKKSLNIEKQSPLN